MNLLLDLCSTLLYLHDCAIGFHGTYARFFNEVRTWTRQSSHCQASLVNSRCSLEITFRFYDIQVVALVLREALLLGFRDHSELLQCETVDALIPSSFPPFLYSIISLSTSLQLIIPRPTLLTKHSEHQQSHSSYPKLQRLYQDIRQIVSIRYSTAAQC